MRSKTNILVYELFLWSPFSNFWSFGHSNSSWASHRVGVNNSQTRRQISPVEKISPDHEGGDGKDNFCTNTDFFVPASFLFSLESKKAAKTKSGFSFESHGIFFTQFWSHQSKKKCFAWDIRAIWPFSCPSHAPTWFFILRLVIETMGPSACKLKRIPSCFNFEVFFST